MHMLAGRIGRTGITPNMVSTAGMIFGILAGAALALTPHTDATWQPRALFLLAAVCIQLRLICNLIDGMVAVEGGKRSPLGEIYNEIPDRISDAATLIGAGYAIGSSPVLGYIAACAAIFVAYVRAVGKGCGMTSDFSGPMAKQQRMFIITLAALALAALPTWWQPLLGPIVDAPAAGIMFLALAIVIAGSVLTAIRRLGRLADFLRQRGVR